jgi:hypothetical protein
VSFIIGAYTAAPSIEYENAADEERFYSEIAALPEFAGLEIGFDTSLHPRNEKWLLQQIKPDWTVVVTLMPGTLKRLASPSKCTRPRGQTRDPSPLVQGNSPTR